MEEERQELTAAGQEAHAQKLGRKKRLRSVVRMVDNSTDFMRKWRREKDNQKRGPDPGAMFDVYACDVDDAGNRTPRDRIELREFEEMMRTEYGDVRDDDIHNLWDGFLASENAAARKHHLPHTDTLSRDEFVKHMLQYGISSCDIDTEHVASASDYGGIDLQEASERDVRNRQAEVRCCRPKTWYIHPDGAFRVSWDVWLLILIFYVAFCVPMRIGFDIIVKPWSVWFLVDLIADISFLSDLVLNFFTGYMDSFGLRVSRGRDVAWNYLGWGPQRNYTVAPSQSVPSPRSITAGTSLSLSEVSVDVTVKYDYEEAAGDATACLKLCTCCFPNNNDGVPRSCRRVALLMTRIVRMPLRGWFFVDLISCLPVSYISLLIDLTTEDATLDGSVDGGTLVGSTRAIRILRLLRLAKLMRVARIGRLLEKYCEDLREFYQVMAVFRAICTTFAMAHWTACGWHFLGVHGVEGCAVGSAEGCSWFEKTTLPAMGSGTDTLWDRYSTSLYWSATTLTTVGYGDVTPVTSSEMIFAVFIEVMGTCTFAFTAGTLSSVIMESKLDPKVQEYNDKMPKIKQYLRSHRVPRSERVRIYAHFDRVFHEHRAVDERNVLELMPGGLKGAMARNVVRRTIYSDTYDLLAKSKLFVSLSEIALVDLIVRLEPLRFMGPSREFPDGEEIIRQGRTCADIYIVTSGCCRSIARAGPPYDEDDRELLEDDVDALLKKGDVFGERSALQQGGGVDRMESTHTVIAKGQPPTAHGSQDQNAYLRRRWTPDSDASLLPSVTTVLALSAASLDSFLDDFEEYQSKLSAVVRVQIETEEQQRRRTKLLGLCHTRAEADADFSNIIESWKPGSTQWIEQAGKDIQRKMTQGGGEQLEKVRSRNSQDCLALVQVQVFLRPWRSWLLSTTLPEPEYINLLSSIFDPDGDRNITRQEFWDGLNNLKDPAHFKRKAPEKGMDHKMDVLVHELTQVKNEVNGVQKKLQDQFTVVQDRLFSITRDFQQLMDAQGNLVDGSTARIK